MTYKDHRHKRIYLCTKMHLFLFSLNQHETEYWKHFQSWTKTYLLYCDVTSLSSVVLNQGLGPTRGPTQTSTAISTVMGQHFCQFLISIGFKKDWLSTRQAGHGRNGDNENIWRLLWKMNVKNKNDMKTCLWKLELSIFLFYFEYSSNLK